MNEKVLAIKPSGLVAFFVQKSNNLKGGSRMELIRSLKQLKRAILEEKKGITEKELFLSDIYQVYLTTMVKGFLPFTGKVKIYEGGDEIAYTEGKNNYINLNSPLVAGLSIKDKNKMFRGLNLHEVGHMLFTDFNLGQRVLSRIQDGIIYPSVDDLDLQAFIDESSRNKVILAKLFMNVSNILEDGYIDRVISKLAPGYAPYLRMVHQKNLESTRSYDEMKKEGLDSLSIFLNSLLKYARFGYHSYEEDEKDDLIKEIKEAEKIVKSAVFSHSPIQRAKKSWEIITFLIQFIKKEEEKETEKSSSEGETSEEKTESKESGESSPESTKDESKSSSLSEALEKAASMMPADSVEHREPSTPSKEAVELAKGVSEEETKEKPEKESIESSESSDLSDTDIDKLFEDLAEEKVEAKQEAGIKKLLEGDLATDAHGIHQNVKSKVVRSKEVTPYGIERFDTQHKELDTIVSRFIRDFLKEITERQIGSTQRGLYFGKRLTVEQVYRKDKRIFQNKIAPEEIPNLAVGILVDLSGSMCGEREDVARKCAYITYKFCKKLEIPCFVIGHDVDFSTGIVRLHVAADELSLDNKDEMRIMSLEAHGDNRDGYALRYCYRKLENIEAETKIMFVISDGAPSDVSSIKTGACSYGSVNGGEDLRNAVSSAIKKGVETIVAGIGSDTDRIKEVYKHDLSDRITAKFIDITDLSKLPRSFIKILKAKLA